MTKKPSRPAHLTTRVLRVRLKDKHAAWCLARAREVNFVWNYCNELAFKVLQREQRFLSAFDLHPYTKGAGKEGLELHSQTVQAIAEEYVTRRKQFKKSKLRWRVSTGPRRSLGWIPFKASALQYKNGQVHIGGQALSLWDSYGLSSYELGSGSLSEDARGRWYLNVTVEGYRWPKAQSIQAVSAEAIGIDLGLKSLMAASDGTNHLHKLSTSLVRKHQAIFAGDVNAQALARTSMAKSVLDAGWSTFRTMLQYKCDSAGVWFSQINEKYSTQDCSTCGARTGPKGQDGLSVRTWTCPVCATTHDRDTNAALNIKARGLAWLEHEFSAAQEEAHPEPACAVNKDSRGLKHSSTAAGVGHGPLAVETP